MFPLYGKMFWEGAEDEWGGGLGLKTGERGGIVAGHSREFK